MGKFLQIRVSAATFRPEDLEKAWPRLWDLAWGEGAAGTTTSRGVLELVQALDDGRRFGEWSPEARDALGSGIERAVDCKERLERALADWDPALANRLSDELEEGLAALEKLAPKPD